MEKAHFEKIRARILETLDKAEEKISIAVCWFTNKTLFDKICEKAKNGYSANLLT